MTTVTVKYFVGMYVGDCKATDGISVFLGEVTFRDGNGNTKLLAPLKDSITEYASRNAAWLQLARGGHGQLNKCQLYRETNGSREDDELNLKADIADGMTIHAVING